MNENNNTFLAEVIIGLGSNIDPELNIKSAFHQLDELSELVSTASVWQTPAYGSIGPDYLNSAALIKTTLPISRLKEDLLQLIEIKLGRIRSADKYADRTIDLDIIIYDNDILDEELWTQAHIAVPVSELVPDIRNPVTGETISQAALRLLPGIAITKRDNLI